jgi:hypothetical protein
MRHRDRACHCLNAGDMTAEGRLRLWQTQDTVQVPLAELQLAPCLKGDQVRVVVDSANAPAGFAAELAQVTQPCTAGCRWHVWLLLVAQRAGTSLVDWCQQEARQPYPALLHRLAGASR